MRTHLTANRHRVSFAGYLKAAWLALCVLAFSGCFSYRSMRALPKESRPEEPRTVLPVRADDVRLTIREDTADPEEIEASDSTVSSQADAAEVVNGVLDTLCKGRGNTLRGPSRLIEETGGDCLDRLDVYLEDPGPADEAWKSAGRLDVMRQLGCERVLVVRPPMMARAMG